MVKIPNMLEENTDYELIPALDKNDYWNIRIKTGDYIECVVSFGTIKVDETGDKLNFDFTLHYSPDDNITVDDYGLQKYVGKILESILINNLNEMEKNENTSDGSAGVG